ncbi:caleosin domain containing protein [Cordyceps fumosorosea ARSEF 2679]|uniref:Caleosin domain containing protein n=1 Tax=Cordyceps fumosorosea (strain ARSEF 2679) TaxID=1081104 RepID=A0A167LQF9_CORFA|nr:caleosin domain containing protein [Cordyceps fumosorosea ARSEF 2679]OAA53372.1 caleosin domain containing protein [Cordyceps fumosorosea ARSEF 2679]
MPSRKETQRDGSPCEDGDSEDIVTALGSVPVTVQRRPFIQPEDDEKLAQAGTARANIAASHEHPDGTAVDGWSEHHKHQTVLQQHCEFFDRDRDGVIWPVDTYVGFRRLGFNVIFSALSAFIIHLNLSYATVERLLPDPLLRIYLARIHKAKHGSDSDAYDTEGRFSPQKFEDIFAKNAAEKESLTAGEVRRMLSGQRLVSDPVGWGAAAFEWTALYLMLWPAGGRLRKEDVRRLYDGSLFYQIAAEREKDSSS